MAWRDIVRRRNRHAAIDAEIAAHLRMAIQDRIDRGQPPADARLAAVREFGNVRRATEDTRAVWSWTTLEQLWHDARGGMRVLVTAPAVSACAILLIALVIGGNTAVFSAAHGLLTRPAPGVVPDGLIAIGWAEGTEPAGSEMSYPDYRDLAAASRSLDLMAFTVEQLTVMDDGRTRSVRGVSVSPNYFHVMGIQPAAGRWFSADEHRLEPGGLAAIISDRLWLAEYHRRDVVGRVIRVNTHHATIVGVAPPHFQGARTAEITDVWLPMLALARLENRLDRLNDRAATSLEGTIGRLRPDGSLASARAELTLLATRLQQARPASAPIRRVVVLPYTGVAAKGSLIETRGPYFLAIFSIVTVITVVIVCANVANLLLERSVSRQREMALRQSFGASRARILRLVLAEGLTMSLVAWGLACLFAEWMSHILPRLVPPSEFAGAEVTLDMSPDWQVLAYAMLLALASTVVFTIAPAVRTWRDDLVSFLKSGGHGVVSGRSRLSRALVVLQLAFAVVLLTSAGLGYRSLSLVDGRDLGFSTEGLLLVTVDTKLAAATAPLHDQLLERLRGEIGGVPGVTSVSYTRHGPSNGWPDVPVARAAGEPLRAEWNVVGPDYLATLGVGVLAGRDFASQGPAAGAPAAIVNQHLAEALWPGQPALGRTIRFGDPARTAVVTAVMPNALVGGFRRDARTLLLLLSARQEPPAPEMMTFHVRHQAALDAVVPSIGRAIGRVDARVPVVYARTVDAQLEGITWMFHALSVMLTTFAGGALLIAVIGQYAAMAFSMRRRVREFAVRIAIGASARQIVSSAANEGLMLTAIGLAIGLTLGLTAGRLGQGLLYGVTPVDRPTLVGVVIVLGTASLVASYLPARWAARIDPVEALRQE